MDFGDSKIVYTPEQVAVTYQLAGVGTRFAAILLDTLIQGALGIVLFIVFGLASAGSEAFGWLTGSKANPAWWMIALFILMAFTLYWGYFLFWEVMWNGQTPGKRTCGIRVMRDGGFPVDFRAAFVRNIVRAVDMLPFAYGTGALSMFVSKESKRLGDFAAGTIVVMDARPPQAARVAPRPPAPAVEATPADPHAAPAAPPPTPVVQEYQVLGDPALLNLRAVTREQFAVVERFLARYRELPEAVRADLARQIAAPLLSVLGFVPPEGTGFPYERFLFEFAHAYRNRPGL